MAEEEGAVTEALHCKEQDLREVAVGVGGWGAVNNMEKVQKEFEKM